MLLRFSINLDTPILYSKFVGKITTNYKGLTMYEFQHISESLEQIDKRLKRIEQFSIAKTKPFLSIEEASHYTKIPKATLYGYVHKGELPNHKLNGRRVYFAIEALDNFILNKKNRRKSNSEIEAEAETLVAIGRR